MRKKNAESVLYWSMKRNDMKLGSVNGFMSRVKF